MNENLSRVYFNGSELSYKVNGVEVINGKFPDKYKLKGDYLISGEDLAAITVALNSNKGVISRIDINGYRFNILIEDSDNIMKKIKEELEELESEKKRYEELYFKYISFNNLPWYKRIFKKI
jgi:hypothetical protein